MLLPILCTRATRRALRGLSTLSSRPTTMVTSNGVFVTVLGWSMLVDTHTTSGCWHPHLHYPTCHLFLSLSHTGQYYSLSRSDLLLLNLSYSYHKTRKDVSLDIARCSMLTVRRNTKDQKCRNWGHMTHLPHHTLPNIRQTVSDCDPQHFIFAHSHKTGDTFDWLALGITSCLCTAILFPLEYLVITLLLYIYTDNTDFERDVAASHSPDSVL